MFGEKNKGFSTPKKKTNFPPLIFKIFFNFVTIKKSIKNKKISF